MRTIPILGDENAPEIPPGARVRVRRATLSELRPGSWVLVRRGGEFTVRRLVEALGSRVTLATSGGHREPPTAAASVLGEVVEVCVPEQPAWWRRLLKKSG